MGHKPTEDFSISSPSHTLEMPKVPAPAIEESKSIYFLKYYFIYVFMLGKLALALFQGEIQ